MTTNQHTHALCRLCFAALLGAAGCYDAGDTTRPMQDDDGGSSDGGSDGGDATTEPQGTGDTTGDGNVDPPAPGNAMIRVIHGSPGAPAVDVYVAGTDTPVIAGLAYSETSDWLEVPAGTYAFEIRAADAAPTDAPVYSTGNLELAEGAMISALAAGVLPQGDDDVSAGAAFRVIPIAQAFDDAGTGEARVRVIHAGADAPAVGIDVGNDGVTELADLERFDDSGAAGVPLPAGTPLAVGIVAEGITVTSFQLPELQGGSHVLVIATGLLGRLPREPEGFGLLAVDDGGTIGFIKQNPTIYALHAGPDAPEVDLCVGDTTLAAHLSFGQMAAAQVPPGSYDVDAYVAPSGCAGTPAMSDAVDGLVAGERYLVIATGELTPIMGEPPLQLQVYSDRFDVDQPAMSALQLVHAASAPEVDVGIVTGEVIENGNLVAPGLAWPETSNELMVQPLTYQIGFAGAGASAPIHPVVDFHVPAEPGERGFVIAAGDLAPEGFEAGFRLLVVDTATNPWSLTSVAPNP